MSIPNESINDVPESSSASTSEAGPSRPVSRTSQHSTSSKASSRKGKERASDVEQDGSEVELEQTVIPPSVKTKSTRTMTSNGGESSDADEEDDDEEEEEPLVHLSVHQDFS